MFYDNPSIEYRVYFYIALGVLAVLSTNPGIMYLGFTALVLPGVAMALSSYLLLYLPFVDWPYVAWTRTGGRVWPLFWLAMALVPSMGVPYLVNVSLLSTDNSWTKHIIPPAPIHAGNILIVEETPYLACNEFCQALLWSGYTDHVMVANMMLYDRPVMMATLFTLVRRADCPVARNGFCLMERQIDQPRFDTVINVRAQQQQKFSFISQYDEPSFRGSRRVVIQDCRAACRHILDVTQYSAEGLLIPLWPRFGAVKSGGDLSSLRITLEKKYIEGGMNNAQILRAAFGFNAGQFHPRPGFAGNVSGGDRKLILYEAESSDILPDMKAVDAYEEKLRAIQAQHPDCPAGLIWYKPGPEPAYLGCGGPPPIEKIR